MANIFNVVQDLANFAAIFLNANLGIPNRVNRQVEQSYTEGKGDTVDVTSRSPLGDAIEYSHPTVTGVAISETKIPVVLTNHLYKAADLTAKDVTLNIRNFNDQVLFPLLLSIANTVEKKILLELVGSFARNVVGTAGTEPSTVAHLTAAVKQLKKNKVPSDQGFLAAINPDAWGNFMGQAQFQSSDYGNNRPNDLKVGQLSPITGITDFFDTQNLGDFAQGDIAGTVLVDGAAQTGSSLAVDAFTAATGTVKKGTRFTINGIAGQTFTVTADAAIASNEATLPIYPALPSSPADDAAITFETAFKENLVFHPKAHAAAIIAPASHKGGQSAISQFNGLSVRVGFVQSGLQEQVFADILFGQKNLTPEAGIIPQG
ncbi:MAG: P22 phage major capsid protein family protein [Candidatus Auribacterota bacterium]|nr:P22 phage major capsid protein family protein [Candidatus Auribacterota bacterium]